mmetsp:Transcript_79132/g.255847  ORF Transcript_79132/g.255847 Transcript_79132/m.255847 type:complete len:315 (-) Transcript_79132:148-1092(-)
MALVMQIPRRAATLRPARTDDSKNTNLVSDFRHPALALREHPLMAARQRSTGFQGPLLHPLPPPLRSLRRPPPPPYPPPPLHTLRYSASPPRPRLAHLRALQRPRHRPRPAHLRPLQRPRHRPCRSGAPSPQLAPSSFSELVPRSAVPLATCASAPCARSPPPPPQAGTQRSQPAPPGPSASPARTRSSRRPKRPPTKQSPGRHFGGRLLIVCPAAACGPLAPQRLANLQRRRPHFGTKLSQRRPNRHPGSARHGAAANCPRGWGGWHSQGRHDGASAAAARPARSSRNNPPPPSATAHTPPRPSSCGPEPAPP